MLCWVLQFEGIGPGKTLRSMCGDDVFRHNIQIAGAGLIKIPGSTSETHKRKNDPPSLHLRDASGRLQTAVFAAVYQLRMACKVLIVLLLILLVK